jgi:hypothetical protein
MDWALLNTVDIGSVFPSFAELKVLESIETEAVRAIRHLLTSLRLDARLADPLILALQLLSMHGGGASLAEQACMYSRVNLDGSVGDADIQDVGGTGLGRLTPLQSSLSIMSVVRFFSSSILNSEY